MGVTYWKNNNPYNALTYALKQADYYRKNGELFNHINLGHILKILESPKNSINSEKNLQDYFVWNK